MIIKCSDFPKGYALHVFDIQSFLIGKIMSKSISGHVRLSIRYAKALEETINIIVYAKFPELLSIDQTRNVTLS